MLFRIQLGDQIAADSLHLWYWDRPIQDRNCSERGTAPQQTWGRGGWGPTWSWSLRSPGGRSRRIRELRSVPPAGDSPGLGQCHPVSRKYSKVPLISSESPALWRIMISSTPRVLQSAVWRCSSARARSCDSSVCWSPSPGTTSVKLWSQRPSSVIIPLIKKHSDRCPPPLQETSVTRLSVRTRGWSTSLSTPGNKLTTLEQTAPTGVSSFRSGRNSVGFSPLSLVSRPGPTRPSRTRGSRRQLWPRPEPFRATARGTASFSTTSSPHFTPPTLTVPPRKCLNYWSSTCCWTSPGKPCRRLESWGLSSSTSSHPQRV